MINFFSHHKCATRWMVAYLSRTAELNGLTFYNSDAENGVRDASSDICFWGNSTYRTAKENGLCGHHIIRNPFDMLLSAYHSHARTHLESEGFRELTVQRKLLNRHRTDEAMYLNLAFTWAAVLVYINYWNYGNPNMTTIRMEDMVTQPELTFRPILSELKTDGPLLLPSDTEMSFETFSNGRKKGQVDDQSHYRGSPENEWRTVFPQPIIDYIRSHMRNVLEKFYPETLIDFNSDYQNQSVT